MSSHSTADGAGALLLYDGTCGVCARSVQWVLRRERPSHRARPLRFASLQGALARELIAGHPELASIDSVIWYEPATAQRVERILVRSAAVLAAMRYVGGLWRALGEIGRFVPRPLRDALYDVMARNRYTIAGSAPACLLPPPEQRTRFVD